MGIVICLHNQGEKYVGKQKLELSNLQDECLLEDIIFKQIEESKNTLENIGDCS